MVFNPPSANRWVKTHPTASVESALDKPIQFLKGVGPQRAQWLTEIGIQTVGDLIAYFPFRYEQQGSPQAIDTLLLDTAATIIGVVEQVRFRPGGQATLRASIRDGTGVARVIWFNASFLRDKLVRGQIVRLFGEVTEHESLAQLVNPRIEWLDADDDPATWDSARIVPVYRATNRLSSSQIARLVRSAMTEAQSELREFLPGDVLQRHGFSAGRTAIQQMHQPTSMDELAKARRRMAYEELFLMQLAISLQRRYRTTHAKARPLPCTPVIDQRIRKRFPFQLTAAQDRVITQITTDLARSQPMVRLLQGDVGSGKTVVALYAALVSVANRVQCAILAPTEVLASQHFAGIEKYLAGSKVNRCLLTGKTTTSQREPVLREIANGQMNLIVGTQALLESKVRFANLGLIVVDEQHKFGVSQRAILRTSNSPPYQEGNKSKSPPYQGGVRGGFSTPHYLVMTATPIPRTLSMTVFGDLEISVIDQLPPGRQPILTRVVREKDETQAWLEVRRRIARGQQAYIVYPLVEESDALDLKAAAAEVHRVQKEFLPGARVGLLHGRMKPKEKQTVMDGFARGQLDALVSTTVIEVGVDVPNATVMVVQHAERYGLSALHQLRGRVGRGSQSSICLLMTGSYTEPARQRLSILCETTDGFRIAEEDLKMRGPGELLGTRQHGWPEFRVANLVEDVDLLLKARDDAARFVQQDPKFTQPAHAGLRAELRRRFRDKVAFIDVA